MKKYKFLFTYYKVCVYSLFLIVILHYFIQLNTGLYFAICGIFIYFIQKRIDEILKVKNKILVFKNKYLRYNDSSKEWVVSISNINIKIVDNIQSDINSLTEYTVNIDLIEEMCEVRNLYHDIVMSMNNKNWKIDKYGFQKKKNPISNNINLFKIF